MNRKYRIITPLICAILAYTGSLQAGGTLTPLKPKPSVYRPFNRKIDACQEALSACDAVVKAQDEAITRLKQNNKRLEEALVSQSPPLLPAWAYFALGAVVGAATIKILSK